MALPNTSWTDKSLPTASADVLRGVEGEAIKTLDDEFLVFEAGIGGWTDKSLPSSSWSDDSLPSTSWSDD